MPSPTVSQVHIQTALTDLSIAYLQEKPPISDRVFPRVSVSKKSDAFFIWNKGQMWRSNVQGRAPGTKFARTSITLGKEYFNCEQYALEYQIPDEVIANQDDAIDVENAGTEWLTDQLNLKKDLTFANDFFKAGIWTVGTVGTAWDNVSSGTPLTAIRSGVRSIRQALGASANHRIIGLGGVKILDALISSNQILERSKGVVVQSQQALESMLAPILGLDELIISDREVNTAKEGETPAYAPVFDNDFLLLARPITPGRMTPSAGYTFAWDEDGKGDMYVEQWRDESVKSDILRGVMHYDQVVTGPELGVFYENPVT